MSADLSASRPPSIPDHELIGRIGAGAYGEVWLVLNALGTRRAAKFVNRHRFAHAKPFEREFSGIQRYEPLSRQHASLVDVLHVGRDDAAGWFYYVMELADSASDATAEYVPKTLRESLRARGRLAVSEVAALGVRIAEGLEFLHANGLVHRDLKPSNIIFVGGEPKLADVGLVATIGEELSFVGTEGYIAPEGPGSPAADIFALGLVLYEAATGQSRHDFPQLPAALAASEEAEYFAELNAVLLRACAPVAGERFSSAEGLAQELRMLGEGRSVRRLRELEKRLRLVRGIGTAVAVLATLAGGAWFFQKRETERARALAYAEARQSAVLAAKEHELRLNLYTADMSQAGEALRAGNLGRARDLLRTWQSAPGGEDVRDVSWSFLAAATEGDPHRTWRGHERNVTGLALGTEQDTVISCGFDGTLREWNSATGEGRVVAKKPGESFYQLVRLASGDFVVGGSTALWLWHRDTGEWQMLAKGYARSVAAAVDGKWVAFGGKTQFFGPDEPVEMVMLDGAPASHVFEERTGNCAASPDGRWFATGEAGGTCRLWKVDGWSQAAALECPGQTVALAFSPDSRVLAAALRDGGVIFWDVDGAKQTARMEGHAGQCIWCMDFSPDGRLLATGGSDGTVHLWDVQARRLDRVLRGHEDEVWAVRFEPDGKRLISSGKDETVRCWDLDAAGTAPLPERLARSAVFSGDGRWFACAERNGPAHVFSAETLDPVAALGIHQVPLGFEGDSLLTSDLQSQLVWWRWGEQKVENEVPLESAGSTAVDAALSPDRRWLAAALGDGGLVVWSAATGRMVHRQPREECAVFSVAFSPDSRWLGSVHNDFSISVQETDGWRVQRTWRPHKMRTAGLAFSPDSRRVLSASWDGTGAVHDIASGQQVFSFRGHTSSLQDAMFLGGDLIAVLESDSSVAFWDLRTGRAGARLPSVAEGSHHDLAASPDGRLLFATRLSGGRSAVWRAKPPAGALEKFR